MAHRAELDALILGVFAGHDRDRLADMLEAAGIANGRVSTMEDLARHPQNRYVEFDTPSGPVRCLAPGALVDGQSPQFGPVPAIDAHGTAIRAEFGAGDG